MKLLLVCAFFTTLLSSALAEESPPRLEPEKMRDRIALHGGGEMTLKMAQAFRKLAGLPDKDIKLFVPKPRVGDVWHKCDFKVVETSKDAEAAWIATAPDGKLGEELLSFLKRGGLVGFSGEAIQWYADTGRLPNARALLEGDEVPEISMKLPLVYRLPKDAGLFFSGRSIRAEGAEAVEVFGWKGHQRKISPGRMADHFALVRASIAVVVDADFPALELPTPVVKNGKLILIGGGATPGGALREFIETAGGEDARILVIPTAEADLPKDQSRFVALLQRRGAGKVTVLHARSLTEADSADVASKIDAATGIWFGGGRQWRLVDRYFGTRAHRAMVALLERGGVIAGSSAGATICGEYLVRGDPLGSKTMMAPGYERGLNFFTGVAIDQHFSQRNRFPDMIALKTRYPQLFGIGLDEATAIVATGHQIRATGRGSVFLYPQKKPDLRIEMKDGDIFSFSIGKMLPKVPISPIEDGNL